MLREPMFLIMEGVVKMAPDEPKCRYCTQRMHSKQHASTHLLSHLTTIQADFKCPILSCPMKYPSYKRVLTHLYDHGITKKEPVECWKCKKEFGVADELLRHFYLDHDDEHMLTKLTNSIYSNFEIQDVPDENTSVKDYLIGNLRGYPTYGLGYRLKNVSPAVIKAKRAAFKSANGEPPSKMSKLETMLAGIQENGTEDNGTSPTSPKSRITTTTTPPLNLMNSSWSLDTAPGLSSTSQSSQQEPKDASKSPVSLPNLSAMLSSNKLTWDHVNSKKEVSSTGSSLSNTPSQLIPAPRSTMTPKTATLSKAETSKTMKLPSTIMSSSRNKRKRAAPVRFEEVN